MTSTKIEFDLAPYLEMIISAILVYVNATIFQASIIKVNNLIAKFIIVYIAICQITYAGNTIRVLV